MTRIRVFIRIPSDDAFELKAQSLNNDPRLKAAGIAALKFTGDKQYIADGDFSPELPPPTIVETPITDSNQGGELRVFVRIPNDDSYELQAQALNKNPLLKKAGIAGLRRVGDKQFIVDGDFSSELPLQDTVETPAAGSNNNEGLHVFVRIPNDDSYELKAQALNKNPLLKKAGISGLRNIGDKKYIVDGEFTSTLPSPPKPGPKSPKPLSDEKLRVTIRMKDDDAYQLIADHLNGDPRLIKAGISDVKLVKAQDVRPAVAPFPLEPVIQVSNQPDLMPAPVTTKKKRKLSGCLAWAMVLGVIGIIITVGGVFAAYTFLPGLFSPPQATVIPPTSELAVVTPTPELMTFDNVCNQLGQKIELEGIIEIFCSPDSCDTHYVELIDVDRDGFMALGLNIKEGEYDPSPNYMADLPVPWETSDFLIRANDGQLIGEDDLVRITGNVTAPLPGRSSGPGLDCSVDKIGKVERINHPTITGAENLTQSTLLEAITNGWVIATISGNGSFLTIDISLESQVDFDLELSIEPGTLFESQSDGVQNMVVRSGTVAVLKPDTEIFFRLEAACANMELKTPSESDTFLVSQSATPDDLIKLLTLSEFRFESFRVQQYAVWAITDNPARPGFLALIIDDIRDRLTDDNVERILSLFQSAGIDISKYQVFSTLDDWQGVWDVSWAANGNVTTIDVRLEEGAYEWRTDWDAACTSYDSEGATLGPDESLTGQIEDWQDDGSGNCINFGPYDFQFAFVPGSNHNQFVGNTQGDAFCGARNGYPLPDPCYGP